MHLGVSAVVLSKRLLVTGVLCCAAALSAGSVVKTGEIWSGVPAKLLRHLSADEKGFVSASAENYARIATEHRCALAACLLACSRLLRIHHRHKVGCAG